MIGGMHVINDIFTYGNEGFHVDMHLNIQFLEIG